MEASSELTSSQPVTGSIRIGTAGWSYKDWEGIFYPYGLEHRKQHQLEYLARFFDTAEIDSSFYEPLRPERAKLWARKVAAVNPNFLFTAKLYRAFTHSPVYVTGPTSAASIRPTDEDEQRTREGLDAIASEGRLGALLIQFPLSYKNTPLNREYLDRLLRQFTEYPRAVEVRDSSWNQEETLAHFAQKNVSFCNLEQPEPSPIHGHAEPITTPVGYVRLHGRDCYEWLDSESRDDRLNYFYKESELDRWKGRIAHAAAEARTTYVIAGNPHEGKAAANALQLKAMLSGHRVAAPPTLIQRFPELRKFADPAQEFGESSGSQMPLLA
jgi:uncharacterized protein YecE (DUF72 family)